MNSIDRQLLEAIESSNLELVRELLAAGANPNATRDDKTAFQLVPYNANDIKCALIEAGAEDSSLRHSLVWVVEQGRVETVRTLIQKGADVNVSTPLGTPIRVASGKGSTAMVDLFIAAGADVDAGSSISTPLLSAIEHHHFNIALKLIAAGADPNRTSLFGKTTPLAMATAEGSVEVVQALIIAGAEVNRVIPHLTINHRQIQQQAAAGLTSAFGVLETLGKTLEQLESNAEEVNLSEFNKVIEQAKTKTDRIESENAIEATLVILAARCGHAEVLAILLGASANPYCKDGEGLTAHDWATRNEYPQVLEVLHRFGVAENQVNLDEQLLIAAEQGNTDTVRDLLAQGTSVNARDQRRKTRNFTPLILATKAGHLEVVNVLLDNGADPNLSDIADPTQKQPSGFLLEEGGAEMLMSMGYNLGRTPLMWAADVGHLSVVQTLLERQLDIDLRDILSYNALLLAVEKGHIAVAECLIRAGVDVNAKNLDSWTALMSASAQGNLPLVELLISQGAIVNAISLSGSTALIAASRYGHLSVIQRLFKAGARVDIAAANGDSVWDIAELYGQQAVLELLQQKMYDEDERWGIELCQPDFTKKAQNFDYQQAVADLGEICGSKPVAIDEVPGWFEVHVNSKRRQEINTEALQRQFLERGCFVYEPDNYFKNGPEKLCIVPTTDKYDVIALHQTNGCNYGIGPGYVVEWLKQLESEQPFILTCIAHDTLAGRFLTPIQKPQELAERMYKFCSDIVDQGCGSVEALAELLQSSSDLFFWWD